MRWAPNSTAVHELAPLTTESSGYAESIWLCGLNTAVSLNSYNSVLGLWTPQTATPISDAGFVTGIAIDKQCKTIVSRAYAILARQAGIYRLGDANFDTVVNFDDLIILRRTTTSRSARRPSRRWAPTTPRTGRWRNHSCPSLRCLWASGVL